MRANAANRLLQHYVDNFRRLPWRSAPGQPAPEPYCVWLSEVMLQQTTVATVTPRYARFLERWPTVEALATASEEDVLHEWAGLGYYARARNLHACAKLVTARGGFPDCEEGLRRLPGVGAYTAAAIAAIAFGRRAVVIDTNVERVVARFHGIEEPLSAAKDRIRASADAMTPDRDAGNFAQAMMDLGATICTPRAPNCGKCPLSALCNAYQSGEPERFPAPKTKTAKPQRFGTAWWIERDGCIWLVRRPAKGLLGGLPALPGDDWNAKVPPAEATRIRHVFTHFALELTVVRSPNPVGDGWWQPLATIDTAGLPTVYRKAVEAVLARDERLAA